MAHAPPQIAGIERVWRGGRNDRRAVLGARVRRNDESCRQRQEEDPLKHFVQLYRSRAAFGHCCVLIEMFMCGL